MRLLALGAVTLAAIGAATAFGATADTPYKVERVDNPNPGSKLNAAFGDRFATGDATGDGVIDVWVSSREQEVDGVAGSGAVALINGATRKIVYRVTSPDVPLQANGTRFAFALNTLGDINGDGLADFGVGTGRQNVDGNAGQGRYYVFDGRTGNLQYRIDNPDPQPSARFGDYASSAGDVTRDGVPDIIISAVANDRPAGCGTVPAAQRPADCRINEGQTYTFDGRNGALVRRFNIPEEDRAAPNCDQEVQEGGANFNVCGSNGFAPRSPGDMTGDGVDEAIVPASSLRPDGDRTRQGRIYIFNGANGEVLSKIDQPTGDDPDALWGFNETGPIMPGDLNADGIPEIYGTGIRVDGPNDEFNAGRAYIFNGRESLRQKRGVVLFELQNPSVEPAEGFGFSADKSPDYNKDGTSDLYVGQLGGSSLGESFIFSGRDGSLLKTLAVPADQGQPGGGVIVRSLRDPFDKGSLGDVNGDCEPDYVMGRPQQDVAGTENQGAVFFFLSSGPSACPPPPPVLPTPPAPGARPPAAPGAPVSPAGKATAKLEVARVQVLRSARRLDVLAPITKLASGRVRVEFFAAGRRFRFTERIDSARGQIRFSRAIPAAQANLGTGILTLTYPGDADTRPQTVRLRAASQRADLNLTRPTITNGRLRANGTVSSAARGVVRVQIEYVVANVTTTKQYNARINDGRWRLNQKLPADVNSGIARRQGTVHSYTLFTGYFPPRIRGEMESFQILGDR